MAARLKIEKRGDEFKKSLKPLGHFELYLAAIVLRWSS